MTSQAKDARAKGGRFDVRAAAPEAHAAMAAGGPRRKVIMAPLRS
ncbi:hypothetical protein [Actinomadura rifamycini]|nr:hypothetical protein [Actinomadura rifamycini]